jgi:hypothetical protein
MADSEDSNFTSLALVLLAAFWSGTSAVFDGIKETNALRDRVLFGKADTLVLSIADRWHVFWWDWAPMKLSIAAISAVLCVVILALPRLRGASGDKEKRFAQVCYIAALMPAIGAIYQVVAFLADAFYLNGILVLCHSLASALPTSGLQCSNQYEPIF